MIYGWGVVGSAVVRRSKFKGLMISSVTIILTPMYLLNQKLPFALLLLSLEIYYAPRTCQSL